MWKALFYDRFVLPRASRIPGIRKQGQSPEALQFSSRLSKWLNDERLVRGGNATDWKKQYKLRHNWSRGNARITETEIAEQPPTPPLLLRLHDEVVIIADVEHGLRAWTLKGQDRFIASSSLRQPGEERPPPTAMAIDMTASLDGRMSLSLGFADGGFSIYTLDRNKKVFQHQYTHAPSSNGTLTAIAFSSPYLLTMTLEPRLSLYTFGEQPETPERITDRSPRLLSSLKSHTAYSPLSLTLRLTASAIIASIAYTIPSWSLRWSIGIQELRLALDGTILDSRIASAVNRRVKPATFDINNNFGQNDEDYDVSDNMVAFSPSVPSSKPTSLSYNHPYLLTAHADNTLILYMVTSTTNDLIIDLGGRLWGHTSSVSGAHVGDRGKAVSVSTKGNELRVWDLEARGAPRGARKRALRDQVSVQVHPATHERGFPRTLWDLEKESDEVSKGWIAFDDEKVVLLKEKMHGAQAVVVYDFT